MDQKAFDLIAGKVGEVLSAQEFVSAGEVQEENGRYALFTSETAAYSVFYNEEKKRFELRTCDMVDDQPEGKWKSISIWLYDPETDSTAEAESISSDFVETIEGPKRVAALKTKKKRKKDEENTSDPLFFFNRFVGLFPELRDELNEEKARYDEIRAVTFARAHLLPKLEALFTQASRQDQIKRGVDLLNDMYVNGDMDVRSIITIVLLNGIENETAIANMKPLFSAELKKAYTAGHKLKGRKIKPEKKKKSKRFVADNLNTLSR